MSMLRGVPYRYAKLGDFGFAKFVEYGARTYTFCGTPGYGESTLLGPATAAGLPIDMSHTCEGLCRAHHTSPH